MTNQELIEKAAAVINPKQLKDGLVGDVGCALVSEKGQVYTGICVGVNSNGYCAERVAIAKMVSDGQEYIIRKIVAVWKDERGTLYVIPPCGHCRQAMRETDERNIDTTEVVLDKEKSVILKELLPYHDWWQKQG